MKSAFSRFVLASVALALATLGIHTAQAEGVSVNVPFSFKAAGKSLPAGQYSVERAKVGSYIKLQDQQSKQSILFVASGTADGERLVSLKFEGQGDTHVLQSIQFGHLTSGRLTRKMKNREDVSPTIEVEQ
jgi:hypothetical protein